MAPFLGRLYRTSASPSPRAVSYTYPVPFKSEKQRAWMYANEPAMAKRWQEHTPKGTKLPERAVKKAFDVGYAFALQAFGLKVAGEEIRLKMPVREFHGFDAAWRNAAERAEKKMAAAHINDPLEPQADENAPAEILTQMFQKIDMPHGKNAPDETRDRLDRNTSWGTPSNMAAGDSHGSSMGQDTSNGGAF